MQNIINKIKKSVEVFKSNSDDRRNYKRSNFLQKRLTKCNTEQCLLEIQESDKKINYKYVEDELKKIVSQIEKTEGLILDDSENTTQFYEKQLSELNGDRYKIDRAVCKLKHELHECVFRQKVNKKKVLSIESEISQNTTPTK